MAESSTKREIDSTTPLVDLLAGVLAGLQVPSSMGGPLVLGAAYDPYREIVSRVQSFGWLSEDDFREYLEARGIS